MLHEEVKKYRELSGDTNPNTPISRIGGYLDGYEKALEQTRWIPVSERLPETNHDVLATDGVEMYVAWYSRDSIQQGWISSDDYIDKFRPIKAWMPLPKDYEPQESEE